MKLQSKERSLPSYAKLLKGYLGFLEGRGKSLSTIQSYRSDLQLFEHFLRQRKKDFYALERRDFEAYLHWMERQGLKTNTKRRKILSAKALVKYAVSRKKLAPSEVRFFRTPERLERLPWIPSTDDWMDILTVARPDTPLGLRNRLVLLLLKETGCTVAELCELRWNQWDGTSMEFLGKKPRKIAICSETKALLTEWRKKNSGKHLFPGFNRHGITSERMTPRGVELYFRQLGRNTGFPHLKPKTLRHFAVTEWLRENVAEAEIQRRLGVHQNYSLNVYRKFVTQRS